jgi:hypothetical protein
MTTTTKLVSMVKVLQVMGVAQIAQYLGKQLGEYKEDNYMVSVEVATEFLNKQVLGRLKYKAQADELLKSKEYLNFNEVVTIESTTKKGNIEKKGTITQLRKFLELKGLEDEFKAMLKAGQLED